MSEENVIVQVVGRWSGETLTVFGVTQIDAEKRPTGAAPLREFARGYVVKIATECARETAPKRPTARLFTCEVCLTPAMLRA